jgi:DNA mismatch repair protein MutL
MPDFIQLLPENVANQIAAGEVIQRPASAVKELMENAVDAGSTRVELFIKDSGKTLIRITDNGCGMSVSDARLAFARHATSKIRTAGDLFSIRTMGFRGEALASIAAISHVELKTQRADEETGTMVDIEANDVTRQQPVSIQPGTTISVKNLFFNIPARRNFLKSDSIEARHIIEEFERVALAHPAIAFTLNLNGNDIFKLPVSNFRQRLVNLYGNNYNERLVPVSEETTLLTINGFVGKPEFSRKTRGEQYLFVNNRFIKDGYLNHAITNAFEQLLPKDSYASYWLFIDIDPARIDVNIHPTKTEIKFEDERSVYAIVRAAVKRSLGLYNVSPALDFDREQSFDVPHQMRYQPVQKPAVTINPSYNPFQSQDKNKIQGWDRLIEDIHSVGIQPATSGEPMAFPENEQIQLPDELIFQTGPYIIQKHPDGILITDISLTHEKLLYNRCLNQLNSQVPAIQQQLFPVTLTFSPVDSQIITGIEKQLHILGFDIRTFGMNTFVLNGLPSGIEKGNEKEILENIIEQYKGSSSVVSSGINEKLAKSFAKSTAVKKGSLLNQHEIRLLMTEINNALRSGELNAGRDCMIFLNISDIAKLLN